MGKALADRRVFDSCYRALESYLDSISTRARSRSRPRA
jgi:hypothetical protein